MVNGIPDYQPALTPKVLDNYYVAKHPTARIVVYQDKGTLAMYNNSSGAIPIGWEPKFEVQPIVVTSVAPSLNSPVAKFELPNFSSSPDWKDTLSEVEDLSSTLNANVKIIGMPYNGKTSWGIYLDCKKGRYSIDGQGDSLKEAFTNFEPKFRDVLKKFYPAV